MKRSRRMAAAGACVAMLLGGCSSEPSVQESLDALESLAAEASRAAEIPADEPPEPTPEPETDPRFASFRDGTHEVGADIQPGTYRTRRGSEGCYWARLKNFEGDLESIGANDNTDDPAVVTIRADDAGFESSRCGTWTADLSQITSSKTSFDAGTYIVGTDIEPGTYRNSGGEGCYWARLRNFEGELDGVIANDNTDDPTIVTIKSSDKGFTSSRCGTWTKR